MAWASEAHLEAWALAELQALGFAYAPAAAVSPEPAAPERAAYHDAILAGRLTAAIARLNPDLPPTAVRDAAMKVRDATFSADPIAENRRLHDLVVRGVPVEHWVNGQPVGAVARLVDWDDAANDWLAINQFEIVGKTPRQPDIVLFLNGLPIVVIELKGTEGKGLPKLAGRKVGGVIFTTIQKFRPKASEAEFPKLTDRSNVIVFVDEAHRSQYGFEARMDPATGEMRYGFAHHMRKALPNATFVGFTGTPVELVNANTYGVFGDQIDVYDIAQSVHDGATVPIYYEARVARIEIAPELEGLIDPEFDDLTSGIGEDARTAAARRWGRVEALVGPTSGSTRSSPTSWSTSTAGRRRWTARR
jgi:type I site-specific restriction-modification system R (restriction) subunit